MKIKYINWSTAIFPGFYESELYNSDTLYNITENDSDELKEGEYYDFTEPDGYSNFEIADMLDISENTVRVRLMRAKKLLKDKISGGVGDERP